MCFKLDKRNELDTHVAVNSAIDNNCAWLNPVGFYKLGSAYRNYKHVCIATN